ncbi:MAG: DEAD/DEAH box helicase [Desulfobacteraceae bacterium]|jgi:DEAD/DEAH box helicase domain-containing protein
MSLKNNLSDYIQAMIQSPVLSGKIAFHRTLPVVKAAHTQLDQPVLPCLQTILKNIGIRTFFDHQSTAIELLRSGHHTVVATPTASGKSLIYNLPIVEKLIQQPDSRAIYLFPLKALAQDQLQTLSSLLARLDGIEARAAVYDGDTSAYQRQKIRSHPPQMLLTNPDMLHLALLPFHQKWEIFFKNLNYVVVDEVHTYRGVMGSHMGLVFRRLLRICRYYNAKPVFIFTSATVAKPDQLCHQLTGLPVSCVDKSGAPKGKRHMVFVDSEGENPARTTILLLKAALARELRTIVYTKSRKYTELIALWAQHQAGRFASRISAYRAGFRPEERRQIETRLANGELLAVVTTSALELGIDIGDLDLCILVGYPGSIVSTWQRGGRVGRGGQESAIVLIAGEDALDQYFLRNPEDFLNRSPEAAVINPNNPQILTPHLECAAAELPLAVTDDMLSGSSGTRIIEQLIKAKRLFLSADGRFYHSRRKYPHRYVDLRGTGKCYKIIQLATNENIGEIDGVRAFRETHPGAIYLHQAEAYLVHELDISGHIVKVEPSTNNYHTRVRSDKDIRIVTVTNARTVFGAMVYAGKVKVTETVIGYDEIQTHSGKVLQYKELDLPPLITETEGCWFIFPDSIQHDVNSQGLDYRGGLHALEHVAIGILPLLVMVDRNDIGGFSTLFHEQTQGASIFIYDGVAGGIGTGLSIFERAEALFERSLTTIESCRCEIGCPSCVHSPKCGSGNHPIDKQAAAQTIKTIMAASVPPLKEISLPSLEEPSRPKQTVLPLALPKKKKAGKLRYGVFDLETQKSAQQVGGWQHADQMRISCAVLYDAEKDDYFEYVEGQAAQLIEHLTQLDLVVGFNIIRFDYKVLSYYTEMDFDRLPTLDMLQIVYQQLGFRLSLDHLAGATLGSQKSADGLMALKWWQEGRLSQIIEYCRKDVRITRDLYLFGKEHGHLFFRNRKNALMRVPVNW